MSNANGQKAGPEVHYEVRYSYYQYNSGAADNGNYVRSKKANSKKDAIALATRINAAAAGELPEDERDELVRDLIPFDGYFHWARAYRVRSQELPL